jgi:hypothetical protein
MMTTFERITISEVSQLFKALKLPPTSQLTVIIKDNELVEKELERQQVLTAMQKLKGSGNGKLLDCLFEARTLERN